MNKQINKQTNREARERERHFLTGSPVRMELSKRDVGGVEEERPSECNDSRPHTSLSHKPGPSED